MTLTYSPDFRYFEPILTQTHGICKGHVVTVRKLLGDTTARSVNDSDS